MTDAPSTKQPVREFAFSRIAGATASDYAAISGTAVAALILAFFSFLAVFSPWALIIPLAALLLAMLAWYYIATSAGTQTGRGVVLAAVLVSLGIGGFGGIMQIVDSIGRQRDREAVAKLAADAADALAREDWNALYEQLTPDYRIDVPLGCWRYQWSGWRNYSGRIDRVEASPRMRFISGDRMLVTLSAWVELPEDGSAVPTTQGDQPRLVETRIRLIYRRAGSLEGLDDDHKGHTHNKAEIELLLQQVEAIQREAESHGPHEWELALVPQIISPLPPPYAEPLVWPSPGNVQWIIVGPGNQVRTEVTAHDNQPTTQPGERLEATLALPPLVPPEGPPYGGEGPVQEDWLTRRTPPPPHVHQH